MTNRLIQELFTQALDSVDPITLPGLLTTDCIGLELIDDKVQPIEDNPSIQSPDTLHWTLPVSSETINLIHSAHKSNHGSLVYIPDGIISIFGPVIHWGLSTETNRITFSAARLGPSSPIENANWAIGYVSMDPMPELEQAAQILKASIVTGVNLIPLQLVMATDAPTDDFNDAIPYMIILLKQIFPELQAITLA